MGNQKPSTIVNVEGSAGGRVVSFLRALGELRDASKRGRVANGEVGEDLAIDLDVCALEAVDELAVGEAVLTRCGVDPDDPQLAHLALALLPVARRVGERVQER